ncbi:MAG: YkgJ family cysteine cluster protein [Leptolyngbyaceae cyanobacterium]
MATWQCIQGCGACCNLTPSERPDLDQYLTAAELEHYLSLVGDDGWCIHYDHATRRCAIYETRPKFCRVQADTFEQMFGISPDELDDFAIDCCTEQITAVYGAASQELAAFTAAIGHSNESSSHR